LSAFFRIVFEFKQNDEISATKFASKSPMNCTKA